MVEDMRRRWLVKWRSRARLAIVVGLLGGLVVSGYAIFWLAANGLAGPGCGGGGCEDELHAIDAHYEAMLRIALVVGGALIVGGSVASRVLSRRLAQQPSMPLPAAVIVDRRD